MVYLPTVSASNDYINIVDRNYTLERTYSETLIDQELDNTKSRDISKFKTADERGFWYTIESKPDILNQKKKKHDSIQASGEKNKLS